MRKLSTQCMDDLEKKVKSAPVELRITERESILLGSLSFFVYFCKNKRQDYEAFDSAFPAFR